MPATVRAIGTQAQESVTPSAESAEQLVAKLDELQHYLDKHRKLPADRRARLKLIERQLTDIKTEIAFKNGRVDGEEWADKAKDDRQRIMVTLDGLLAELADLILTSCMWEDSALVLRLPSLHFSCLLISCCTPHCGQRR